MEADIIKDERPQRRGRQVMLWLPLVLLVGILIVPALFAPLLAPHDPLEGSLAKKLKPPAWVAGGSWEHPLGTDPLGRDILS